MILIEHQEVGSGGAASITFSDIPQTYTDLYLVLSSRSSKTGDLDEYLKIAFNGLTTNLSSRALYGTGASAASNTVADQLRTITNGPSTASTFNSTGFYIPNYTSATAKSVSLDSVGENNATTSYMGIAAGLWNSTAAITSVQLTFVYGNFAQYSSATLYGVRKYDTAGAPKATGGLISFDAVNNKWVHAFTASGTFTPSEDLTGVEYLIVAGGGSGPGDNGGGGGAGGYRSSVVGESSGGGASAESTLSLTSATGYTVTIGAGGAGVTGGNGNPGSNSTFNAITAVGGGYGGSYRGAVGGSGGSGGGHGGGDGGTWNNTTSTVATGTANQGYNGGVAAPLNKGGAGGGGAGGVGADATTQVGGNGGAGVTSSITGSAVGRAGGGGGSGRIETSNAGGSASDGGGAGGPGNSGGGTKGSPNTGGGGGGAGYSTFSLTGGSGGSGIVIVRYSA